MADDDDRERRRDQEALMTTVATLNTLVQTLDRTVKALNDQVDVIQAAVFGRFDPQTLHKYPGLQDEVAGIRGMLNTAKWALLPIIALMVGHDLGIPTELIGKAIMALLGVGK